MSKTQLSNFLPQTLSSHSLTFPKCSSQENPEVILTSFFFSHPHPVSQQFLSTHSNLGWDPDCPIDWVTVLVFCGCCKITASSAAHITNSLSYSSVGQNLTSLFGLKIKVLTGLHSFLSAVYDLVPWIFQLLELTHIPCFVVLSSVFKARQKGSWVLLTLHYLEFLFAYSIFSCVGTFSFYSMFYYIIWIKIF